MSALQQAAAYSNESPTKRVSFEILAKILFAKIKKGVCRKLRTPFGL